MPEWTGTQQLILFGQSWLFGVCLGFVFSVFNVPSRLRRRHRLTIFISDMLFFVVAALATFYFSLAMMDGRMHPLLFGGASVGLLMQHKLIGRWLTALICVVGRFFVHVSSRAFALLMLPIRMGISAFFMCVKRFTKKTPKNIEKQPKKPNFFQKNT